MTQNGRTVFVKHSSETAYYKKIVLLFELPCK